MNNVKNKLNIIGRCYVKENSCGGEILSFVPEIPGEFYLDDLLVILSVPTLEQKFSASYIRLQNKINKPEQKPAEEIKEFTEVRSVCYLKESKRGNGDILVCAPKQRVKVSLDQIVIIACIPAENKTSAPIYIKKKVYNKSKSELDGNIETKVIDDFAGMSEDQVNQIMEEIN